MVLKNNHIKILRTALVVLACTLMSSCKYSLSGYEIIAKTATVNFFANQAPVQSADLSQMFTNKLEQKVIRETPLKLVQSGGELEFSGAITSYSIRAVAVRGTENTAESQLSIGVNVEFIDTLDDEKDFTQTFTASETFDANADLTSIENQLLENITDQLVDDIFNRAFINW